jgi:hypothetical protein
MMFVGSLTGGDEGVRAHSLSAQELVFTTGLPLASQSISVHRRITQKHLAGPSFCSTPPSPTPHPPPPLRPTSCSMARAPSLILSNSSMQQMPLSLSTSAPLSSTSSLVSGSCAGKNRKVEGRG